MNDSSNGVIHGIAFGLTSGVITTLGLIVGLYSGTHSKVVVLGGIITIAVADSMSDALGIHIAKESENTLSTKQVWVATFAAFFTKLLTAATFIVPVLLFPLNQAIIVSVIWGILVLSALSFAAARWQKIAAMPVILEHVGIAIAVIILTNYIGQWVARVFSEG